MSWEPREPAMTARSDVLFITDKTKLLKSALGQKRRSAVGRTLPVFPTTRTYLVPVGMSQTCRGGHRASHLPRLILTNEKPRHIGRGFTWNPKLIDQAGDASGLPFSTT